MVLNSINYLNGLAPRSFWQPPLVLISIISVDSARITQVSWDNGVGDKKVGGLDGVEDRGVREVARK